MISYLPVFLAFGLMFFAVPVPVCLLAGTLLYFGVINPSLPITSVFQNIVTQSMSTSMMAAPFFILAGSIMNYAGITGKLLDMCDCLLGHKEGGLAYINVLLSTLNGGMCGSANADAALQCKLLVPEMEKKGYPRPFCTAVTAASSLITPIIPPGVPLILYGIMTGVSVGKMWVAGYVPGIMLCIGMMIVCYIYAHKYHWKSARETRATAKELVQAIMKCFWALLIPIFMIIGLRSGLFTATEGGTVLIILAVLIGIIYRSLKFEHFKPIMIDAFRATANVMLIIVSACGFSMYLSWERIPHMMAEWMMAVSSSKYMFILLSQLIVFILGMFLDGTALLLILTPLFYPIAQSYGIDLIQFGMIMLVNLYCGCLTPPFGTLMYVTCNLTDVSIPQFCKYGWAFVVVMLTVCLIMAIFPGIPTFLPNLVYGA